MVLDTCQVGVGQQALRSHAAGARTLLKAACAHARTQPAPGVGAQAPRVPGQGSTAGEPRAGDCLLKRHVVEEGNHQHRQGHRKEPDEQQERRACAPRALCEADHASRTLPRPGAGGRAGGARGGTPSGANAPT